MPRALLAEGIAGALRLVEGGRQLVTIVTIVNTAYINYMTEVVNYPAGHR
jgi:hypothetical protein